MLNLLLLFAFAAALGATGPGAIPPKPATQHHEAQIQQLLKQISESGQFVTIGQKPPARLQGADLLAPGPPPVLQFRFLQGEQKHRFGNIDLVMDDAGH